MNIRRTRVTPQDVSLAIAQLMPNIIRGIQLDFFIKRGVTQTQFLILSAVRAYGRCTMGTLANNLHVSMPTISGVVERLVRSGHVRRQPQPGDRRQVIIELTPRGQQFFHQFQTVVRRRWEEVLRSLEPQELEAFHHVVTKLHAQLQPLPDHD